MTITPRFEADIGADISKFMQKANEVDAKIREMATGVVIDITAQIQDFMSDANKVQDTINDIDRTVDVTVNGNITDLERAITEANAQIAALNDSATVNINGNNSNFNNAAGNVNKATRSLSRRITEARIGANIGDFESRMVEVTRALTEAGDTVTPRIEADITDFNRDILEVQDRMREIARTTANPEVEADIAGFMAQMALVQAQLNDVVDTHDVDIHADTASARVRLGILWAQIRSMTLNDHVIKLRASWANYQQVMGAMANFSRNFGEIVGMTARGIGIFISPAIVPIIASLVGLLGNLGPMLGTVAGSTFALGTAFAAAGAGAVGFAAVAIPAINDFQFKMKEIEGLKAEMKIAEITGETERYAEAAKKLQAIQDGLTVAQNKTQMAMAGLTEEYGALKAATADGVLSAYAKGITIVKDVMIAATPMIMATVDAVQRLMDAFNRNLEAEDVKAFFNFLNTQGASSLQVIGEALGNFMQGIFNMMAAFGPLSVETQGGFLRMSEGFRQWSAALGENDKFQAFISYVSENMPKIRSIFSDAIQGIIHMFAAFGDSSSGMMSRLETMMQGFLNWSKALGDSQGFKNFINYVQTNGPVVVSTIGNIVTFIINLGKAAAPMGQALLAGTNAVIGFLNGLLQAHPWVGKVGIAMVVMTGAFLAALPTIVGLNALTGGLITTFIKLAATWTIAAVKMAAGWVIAMGPIGWVTVAVAALAILIYKYWDEISAWTKKTWSAVSSAVTSAVNFVMSIIQSKFPALHAVIQSTMTMTKNVISTTWSYIKGTFQNVLSFLKALVSGDFQGMQIAIMKQMQLAQSTITKIWNSIKSFLSQILGVLLDKFGSMFAKIVVRIREKMGEAVAKVSEKVSEMPGKVLAFVSVMKSAGSNLIQGLIDGAVGMASSAISSVRDIAGDMVGAALSFFKIKSPSRVFMEMGAYVSEGLAVGVEDKARSAISSVQSMAAGMTTAFNPRMELADMRASAQLDTSVSRADMGVVRHAFAAEVGEVEKHEPDLYLVVDGKELGKVVAKPVQEENERRGEMVRVGRGR